MKPRIDLFVDDFSIKAATTELNDLSLKTYDFNFYSCNLGADTWGSDTDGYNLVFEGPTGGFSLELNQEGFEILKELINKF